MKVLDKDVKMMDSGLSLISSEKDFTTVSNQIMTILGSDGGKVSKTGPSDMVLDYSTPWRNKFISCHLEEDGKDAQGKTRYAASFMEGNASNWLRRLTQLTTLTVVLVITAILSHGFLEVILFILFILTYLFVSVLPSYRSQKRMERTVREVDISRATHEIRTRRPARYECAALPTELKWHFLQEGMQI
jgi:hypothetical protein